MYDQCWDWSARCQFTVRLCAAHAYTKRSKVNVSARLTNLLLIFSLPSLPPPSAHTSPLLNRSSAFTSTSARSPMATSISPVEPQSSSTAHCPTSAAATTSPPGCSQRPSLDCTSSVCTLWVETTMAVRLWPYTLRMGETCVWPTLRGTRQGPVTRAGAPLWRSWTKAGE